MPLEDAARLCVELGHEVVDAVPKLNMPAAMQASGTLSVVSLAERIALREAQLGRAVSADDLELGEHGNAQLGAQGQCSGVHGGSASAAPNRA